MKTETIFESIGAVFAVIAATLVALNFEGSKYGFILFFMSTSSFLVMAYQKQMKMFFMSQIVFQIINIIGIYHWFFLK